MKTNIDALRESITKLTEATISTPADVAALERLYPQYRAAIAEADKALHEIEKSAVAQRKQLRADLRAMTAAYKRALAQTKTAP